MLFFVTLCADESMPSFDVPLPTQRNFQTLLLKKVFENANKEVLSDFSQDRSFDTICQWRNIHGFCEVKCDAETGLVVELSISSLDGSKYSKEPIGQLNVEFFPHSLLFLRIGECSQKRKISTRSFPRNAQTVYLGGNKYFGTPDLTKLSENLQDLYLGSNRLTGPINLCFLPKSLEILDLQSNMITQNVVWYQNLSENVEIFLEGNSIGGLYALTDTPKIGENHKIKGIKESKIH